MPYVQMNTSADLSREQKTALEKKIAEQITLIPNKIPENTMVEINDGLDMYFLCTDEPCMKISVELFNPAPFEAREAYAVTIMKYASEVTRIPESRIYMNYVTFDHWGRDGILKQSK